VCGVQTILDLAHSPLMVPSLFQASLMLPFWWQLVVAAASVSVTPARLPTRPCAERAGLASLSAGHRHCRHRAATLASLGLGHPQVLDP